MKYKLIILFLFLLKMGSAQDLDRGIKSGAVEQVDKRTLNSKTFLNNDNSYTTAIYPYEIHFVNDQGMYEEYPEGTADNTTTNVSPSVTTVEMFTSYYDLINYETSIKFGYYTFPIDDRAQRSYVYWNTSSIPVYANISEARITWNRSLGTSTSTFYLYKIDTYWGSAPSSGDAYNLWQDCAAGTLYASMSGISGTQTFTSNSGTNSSFLSDLNARLSSQWMACAFKNSNENNGSNHYGMTGGTLYIDWTAPSDLCITTFTVNNGQTFNYDVSGYIVVPCSTGQTYTINSGGTVTMEAGSYIQLNPGFHAKTGCSYTGRIGSSDDDNIMIINNEENKPSEVLSNMNSGNIPSEFSLLQNYPNPFNPTTLIQYGLKENSNVNIIIFDITGRIIKTLVAQHQDAGYKSVMWDGTNDNGKTVSTGVYIYKILAGNFIDSKKMLLLK